MVFNLKEGYKMMTLEQYKENIRRSAMLRTKREYMGSYAYQIAMMMKGLGVDREGLSEYIKQTRIKHDEKQKSFTEENVIEWADKLVAGEMTAEQFRELTLLSELEEYILTESSIYRIS